MVCRLRPLLLRAQSLRRAADNPRENSGLGARGQREGFAVCRVDLAQQHYLAIL